MPCRNCQSLQSVHGINYDSNNYNELRERIAHLEVERQDLEEELCASRDLLFKALKGLSEGKIDDQLKLAIDLEKEKHLKHRREDVVSRLREYGQEIQKIESNITKIKQLGGRPSQEQLDLIAKYVTKINELKELTDDQILVDRDCDKIKDNDV